MKYIYTLQERLGHIKGVYWERGKDYLNQQKVGDIKLSEDDEGIQINADVHGNGHNVYFAELSIEEKYFKIYHYCRCLAHNTVSGCKHVAALVLKMDVSYEVDEHLNIYSKSNKKLLFSHLNSQNIPDVAPEQKQIDIFSQLKTITLLPQYSHNRIFKMKIHFVMDYYEENIEDIEMNLYECKLLKNGNYSTGKQIYRNAVYSAPNIFHKYKQLSPYSHNNWDQGSGHITFGDNPEYFLQLLFDLSGDITDTKNNPIILDKHINPLKIDIKKQNEDIYTINLVILSEKYGEINILNQRIIPTGRSDYFACVTNKNELYFFQTDIPMSFIHGFMSQEMVVNKQELQELQASENFENIVKNSLSIDIFELEEKKGIPKGKFIIDMKKDFSEVFIDFSLTYGENKNITPKNSGNISFFVEQEKIIHRDLIKEDEIFAKVMPVIDMCKQVESVYIKKVDQKIDIFFDMIEELIHSGFIGEYKKPTKRISQSQVSVKLDITSGIDFFDAKTTLTIGDDERAECAEILTLLENNTTQNKGTITLKNGTTFLIKNDIQNTFDFLNELGIGSEKIGKNIQIAKHTIGLLSQKTLDNNNIIFSGDNEIIALKKSLSDFDGIKNIPLPKNLNATLRDYQNIGYNWIHFLEKYNFSGILADDMGLGKTIQTLSVLQKIYNKKSLTTQTLIICPTSLMYNWQDEALKFTPDLRVELVQNGKIGFSKIKKDTQVIIGSYGIISNLVEQGNIPKMFHYLILDESQNIKNPATKRTKSICMIPAKYRLALSGTPIENNLAELWSVFHFLMPGFLGNLSSFRAKYMKESQGNTLDILSAKTKPFILRRTKEEVLKELPPKQTEILRLEMGTKQKTFYTKLKNTFKLQINKELAEQGLNKSRFKVLDALLKLRQACLLPALVNMENNTLQDSIKLKYLEENIDDMIVSGHNLLIFSQFTGFLKYVKEIFNAKNIAYNYIDGRIKSLERKRLVDDFNNGDTKVFIISLKAGGTGLNLTKADYVIHMDPWWNPAVENQATDRAHRMGQEKTVFVKKLIVKDSIEEKILELQEKKKKLVEDMFSGNFSGSLTKNDIDFIFE